jgi:DNA-binding beta-propeller fold protein YncE
LVPSWDTATNTVSATINISLSTTSQPQGVAITPNGANVYVTNDYPTVSVMTIGGINPVGNGGNGGNGGTTGLGGSGGAAGTPGGTSGTRGQNGVVIPG